MTDEKPPLTVVGIGEDGWSGLDPQAREALEQAETIIGGVRHLDLLPDEIKAGRDCRPWPSPLKPYLEKVAAEYNGSGERMCILASGDPLLYGVGSHFTRLLPAACLRVIPHVSSFALVCARMLWDEVDTALVTACGRPVEVLNGALFDRARIVLFSAGSKTPVEAAGILMERGFEASRMTIFEHVGGRAERLFRTSAAELRQNPGKASFADLNAIAIECAASSEARIWSLAPGLPEQAYEHDGQITRRDVRSITLARLSPRPGELLWDIGAGSGSIGIEWMRAAPHCRAIAIEKNPARADRIRRNALGLGVHRLQIVEGKAANILTGLPIPDAIFIGGGITRKSLIKRCFRALRPGGRLVANSVTFESESKLHKAYKKYGGDLTRIAISRPDGIGSFTAWSPSRPVVQWALTKPYRDPGEGGGA